MLQKRRINLHILFLSIIILFLELFLIRLIGTEIRIFAYVNNLVLLSCFIGLGAGNLLAQRPVGLIWSFFFIALISLMVSSEPFVNITNILTSFADEFYWFESGTIAKIPDLFKGIVLTLTLFVVISAVFFPLGQLLGNYFDSHNNTILAYTINIIGSILGVWIFSFLSYAATPPLVWFAVVVFLAILFLEWSSISLSILIFLAILTSVLLGYPKGFPPPMLSLWTPYQQIKLQKNAHGGVENGFLLKVNNVNYMSLINLSSEFVNMAYKKFPDLISARATNPYEIPYIIKGPVKNVLIVGSGGGNDVAAALRNNASEVDAVEIDPYIYNIGLQFHPERPYSDKRVHVFVDDARSYFKKCSKSYDLVVFGLLDAHTQSSSYNNIRLDHYVYTLESIQEARKLLKEDGMLSLTFDANRPWISVRLKGIIEKAFGHPPVVLNATSPNMTLGWGGTLYVASNSPNLIENRIDGNPLLLKYVQDNRISLNDATVPLSTDDWPYLYIEKRSIPKMYLCIIVCLLILILVAAKVHLGGLSTVNPHFFLLGAGFLLLEFQNISKSSLLFGATWQVNAYTITSILALILLANLCMAFIKKINISIVYALLVTTLISLFLTPFGVFNSFDYFTKATIIVLILNLPIFFAGLIFIHDFKAYAEKSKALASNLFGACLGGLFEPLSFVFGIKSLILITILCYCSSYFARKTN